MAQQNKSTNVKGAFWRTHIAQQKKSGKTEKSYCNENALSYSTFRWWKKKLNDEAGCFVQLTPEKCIHAPQGFEFIIPGMGTLVFTEEVSFEYVAKLICRIREVGCKWQGNFLLVWKTLFPRAWKIEFLHPWKIEIPHT